jgi:Predicted Zn peptidase
MLAIAEQEGIFVEDFALKPPLSGIYLRKNGKPPIIGLSKRIRTTRERRCIMAEELGHHFTSCGSNIPREFYHYAARLTISKTEHRALKWAAKYLIPRDKLCPAIENGVVHTWELADYFNVTESMIRFRAKLPDMQKFRSLYAAKNTALN